MRLFATDAFSIPLPDGHFFPLEKYRLVREAVEAAGLGPVEVAPAATDEQLALAHTPDYVARVRNGELAPAETRRIGFPWSAALVERSLRSCGSTIAACRAAYADGVAAYIGGGTHHAFADAGEGYCVFNDSAVAARVLQHEGKARRVVILDCDAHQGNGTASVFRDDPTVFTFSIHGERSFPRRKERSDLDIALPDRVGDSLYLAELERGVRESLRAACADFAIYLAGADPHGDDRIGRMRLTPAGLRARDALVLEACARGALPVAVTLAGGYGRDVRDTVDVHVATLRLAAEHAARG